MTRALVTGGNGLIGTHLVRVLLARGYQVRVFVRPAADATALSGLPIERHVGDVRSLEDLRAAADGCALLFHTAVPFAYAGQVDDDVTRIAVEGTRNVLHAAKATGISRVVVTSSSVVFGYATRAERVDIAAGPVAPSGQPDYVLAKVRQDDAALRLAADLGVEVVLACPTMAVGPFAPRLGPSNAIVVQYLADPTRATYPGGIDVVAVEDVASGHLLIAESGRSGHRYVLNGEALTWEQVHTIVAELTGVEPPRWTATHLAAYLAATGEEVRARLGRRAPLVTREQASMVGRYYWYADDEAAALGYTSRPAREALVRAIAWLAARPPISRELRATMHLHPDVHAARRSIEAAEAAIGVRG